MRVFILFFMVVLWVFPATAIEIDSDANDAVDVANGGTNATTVGAARTNLDVYSKSEADAADGTGTDDQTAAEVVFTPDGSIAATNVQAAIVEVRDEAGSGGTDDQTIDVLSLAGTTLSISLEDDGEASQTVDLSSLGGSMVWPSVAGIPYWTSSTSWGGAYTLVTTIGATGSDTNIPSEQGVREELDTKYESGDSPTFGTVTTTSDVTVGGALTVAPSATPSMNLNDSDGAGAETADKYAGGVEANMTTTTEDSEVSDVTTYYQNAGTKTAAITVDGSANTVELGIQLLADETGIEGQATDAITDCSSFSATGGGLFYDDSEGVWKKCQDNVMTVMDTTSGTTLTEEQVEDYVGTMLGGTETRITVTYDDAGNAINFVVDDMNDDIPESGDFGAAVALDADGGITAGTIVNADINASAAIDESKLDPDLARDTELTAGTADWYTTGTIGGKLDIVSKSSSTTLTAQEVSGTVVLVTAATQTMTLPTAVAGYVTCIQLSQGVTGTLTVTPGTGDYIVDDGVRETAATAYAATSAAGNKICLFAGSADDWYLTSTVGTWSE